MAQINGFRDLKVYQQAVEEARTIFELTFAFPKDEAYSLTDQMRRSSRAVGAILAEAWARRRYRAAFVNKINQAQAEAMETQVWLEHAKNCGYLPDDAFHKMDRRWQQIGGMLERMIQRADAFCRVDELQ
ncbi:MAG: four helix bundle protein [Bacteroidota bacterium]